MRTSDEIIEDFVTEDKFDIVDATKALAAVLNEVASPLGQGDILVLELQGLAWRIDYLGNLLLQVGSEAGVLPAGYDEEVETLAQIFEFDAVRRLYDRVVEKEAPPKGVSPDQLVIGDVIDEEETDE